jgi:hypothetical protein
MWCKRVAGSGPLVALGPRALTLALGAVVDTVEAGGHSANGLVVGPLDSKDSAQHENYLPEELVEVVPSWLRLGSRHGVSFLAGALPPRLR